jgi:hypothetical protein
MSQEIEEVKHLKDVVETNGQFEQVLKDNPTKNYLPALKRKTIMSAADFEDARAKNILNIYTSEQKTPIFKITYFACACGSRNFKLLMHGGEITAECAICGNSDIIAWYANGHIRNLETQEWCTPDLLTLLNDERWIASELEKIGKLRQSSWQVAVQKQGLAQSITQYLLDDKSIQREEFADVRKSIEDFLREVKS